MGGGLSLVKLHMPYCSPNHRPRRVLRFEFLASVGWAWDLPARPHFLVVEERRGWNILRVQVCYAPNGAKMRKWFVSHLSICKSFRASITWKPPPRPHLTRPPNAPPSPTQTPPQPPAPTPPPAAKPPTTAPASPPW